jgi:hypothetical protein
MQKVKVNSGKKKVKGKNKESSLKSIKSIDGEGRASTLKAIVLDKSQLHRRGGSWKDAVKAAKVFKVSSGGIPRSIRPFWGPARHTFKYCDILALSSGAAGTTGVHAFACNSLYDPDQTGTGHQPLGFDELKVFFDHYVVISARIKVRFSAAGATANSTSNMLVGIILTDDLTSATDPRVFLEQPFGVNSEIAQTLSHDDFRELKLHWTAKEWYHVNDPMDAFDNIGALYSANPSEMAYFTVWTADTYSGDSTRSIRMTVEIDYDAVLLEPAEVGLS